MIKQFIESVREEKDGFILDKPWRLEESSIGVIIPVLRSIKKDRTYITLAEARHIKIEDTGDINFVYVKSEEGLPVLISRGEIFRGKTQERAAIHDHLVFPGKGLRVAVRCVHASKGINIGSEMKSGGRTPYKVNFVSQGKTWETVKSYHTQYTCSSSSSTSTSTIGSSASRSIPHSDDLASTLDSLTESLKEVLKKIPYIDNQVGAIFYRENKLMGLDVYDLPDSWKKIKEDVVEKEGASFLEKDEDNMFDFKPEKAKAQVQKHLGVEFNEKEIWAGEYKLIEIRSENLIGEALIYGDNVLHLTMWKN